LVTPKAQAKHEPFVQWTGLRGWGGFIEQSQTKVAQQSVTKIISLTLTIMSLVTLKTGAKHELEIRPSSKQSQQWI
jgi:hypothetical protein